MTPFIKTERQRIEKQNDEGKLQFHHWLEAPLVSQHTDKLLEQER